MTLAHYDFVRGSPFTSLHPQEEVYGVMEGELEVTIDVAQIGRAGLSSDGAG
jgi:hypothetical protein